MDLDQIKQILDLVRQHDLSEFEIEQEGLRLKIRKDSTGTPVVVTARPGAQAGEAVSAAPASTLPVVHASAGLGGPPLETDVDLAVVKSPIVGTFYRSPEPGAAVFVEIGSTVKKGQVLCIIEAMKLMNEIDSEYDGEIAAIYVESGQSVQYGERLFAIKTS